MFALFLTGHENALNTQFFDAPPPYVATQYPEQQKLADSFLFLEAETSVRALLSELVSTIPDKDLRNYFSDSTLPLRELLKAVKFVPPYERKQFIEQLLLKNDTNIETRNFIEDKIDNVLSFCSISERTELVRSLCNDSRANDSKLALALRSCRDLRTMNEVSAPLLQSEHLGAETKDLLSTMHLYTYLRSIRLEQQSEAVFDEVTAACELQARLEQIKAVCLSDKSMCNSSDAKFIAETIDQSIQSLQAECSKGELNSEQLREVVNKYIKKCNLELRYGIQLSVGKSRALNKLNLEQEGIDIFSSWKAAMSSDEITLAPTWSDEDLADVEMVLNKMPESVVLFTPLLSKVELVPWLGWGILGARYSNDGCIRIASWARNNASFSTEYEGVSSFAIVLAHEMGHGIQIGDGPSDIVYPNSASPSFENGQSRYDFDEYLALSGWEVIARNRYIAGSEPGTVVLDGNSIKLEEEVIIDGKPYTFHFMAEWNVLMCYRADKEFSHRDYAKASPWEDFAEAFAEYILLPHRLAKEAPHKFQFMQDEFE